MDDGKREMQNRIVTNAALQPSGAARRGDAEPLLNREVTLSRFAGDEALLSEIAGVFVKTVPQLMGSVTDAVTSNDLNRVFHHAHSLKGAVAAFEAPEVLKAVVDLERHAKRGDVNATASALPEARALIERLVDELTLLGAAGSAV
jgi:HPt (histidine-containing phosphotransfer) domain-containing protein